MAVEPKRSGRTVVQHVWGNDNMFDREVVIRDNKCSVTCGMSYGLSRLISILCTQKGSLTIYSKIAEELPLIKT